MKTTYFGGKTCQVLKCLTLLIFLACASSCQTEMSPLEKLQTVFNSSPTCTTPCWGGIRPGETTLNDFLVLVDSSSSRTFDKFKHNTLLPEGEQYIWYDHTTSLGVTLEAYDGVVSFIKFQPLDINLEHVFNVLGPPDKYTAYISEGEIANVYVKLFYEEEGVILALITSPPDHAMEAVCTFNITPEVNIEKIYLVNPSSTENMMKDLSQIFYFSPGLPLPWTDIGTIALTLCQS